MEIIATLAAIAFVIVVIRFAKYLREQQTYSHIQWLVGEICNDLAKEYDGFFNYHGEIKQFRDSSIELEFKHLRHYSKAFARQNITLMEASEAYQERGYSHVLYFFGNTVPVKNFVDVTYTGTHRIVS